MTCNTDVFQHRTSWFIGRKASEPHSRRCGSAVWPRRTQDCTAEGVYGDESGNFRNRTEKRTGLRERRSPVGSKSKTAATLGVPQKLKQDAKLMRKF